jgi:serine/threonine protein phosphatase PrpC
MNCDVDLSFFAGTKLPGDADHTTLSRDNPISEFLRQQKESFRGMSQEEFDAKFQAHMKLHTRSEYGTATATNQQYELADSEVAVMDSDGPNLNTIVLKFTTLSENCSETPSFVVSRSGAKIGREPNNEVCVPSDTRLAPYSHTIVEYSKGSFYIIDCGYDFSASVRIGVGGHQEQWVIESGAQFSAGNSVFRCHGEDIDGNLILEVIEGPLKGTTTTVTKEGATLGRSSDNKISIPDRELSRRHSKVDFDEKLGRFVVLDIGSTNGTYVQLVGPYAGRHKLNLNDHILVGRTGFSVNRFDYGLSEEMGHRQTMEDACAIVQHLNIGLLNTRELSPQSFFGVYDGHGGDKASLYLSQHLHVNIAGALVASVPAIMKARYEEDEASGAYPRMDEIVTKILKETFLRTDADFIGKSPSAQHGSTATTALVLGDRLYCANVGDSRTLLCRNFTPMAMSVDHKPAREDEAQRIRDAGNFCASFVMLFICLHSRRQKIPSIHPSIHPSMHSPDLLM